MLRRLVLALLCAAGVARADDLAARAQKLHRAAIVIDTHMDVPDALSEKPAKLATRGATTSFDIPRAREGGLDAVFFSIYVAAEYAEDGLAAGRALELIDLTRRVVAENPNDLELAASVADLRKAVGAGKIAIMMGIEGGHAIESSLGALREMYRAGVRYMTLTHVNTNDWADSSGGFWKPDFDPKAFAIHGGLTDHGREIVREMNRLGMIVDISHVSDDTLADVLETSTAPVMASHSSCRALSPAFRNLTDDQIRAIVKKGGVVMINFESSFLDPASMNVTAAGMAKMKDEYLALKKQLAATGDKKAFRAAAKKLVDSLHERPSQWTKIVDHIEHVLAIAGPKSVGLGSDFDGGINAPAGMEDVSMLPKITEELLRRGHSEDEVRGVLGENFLAFWSRVEAAAARSSTSPQ